MRFDADVAIVGGGPAGSATALALAFVAPELASRTVVLEKARYPRDKPCAGAIGARGDALLREIGVDVRVPSVAIDGVSFRASLGSAVAAPGKIGRVVRRLEFDHALALAAAARGVEVRDGVTVDGSSDEGTQGVLLRTSAGPLRTRVAVGCDGVGSVIRKDLGVSAGRLRAQVIEVDTEPVEGDADRGLLHFDVSDSSLTGYAWDFPTLVGGRALVCRGVYRLKGAVAEVGQEVGQEDVAKCLTRRLLAMGIDPSRAGTRRYAERGFEPATRLASGGRMLVGESAGIDALTGEGIAQAIEYGVLAGRFIARTLRATARGEVDVSQWNDIVARSPLSRELRTRARFLSLVYGRRRRAVEAVLTRHPAALWAGARHFGAQPPDWPALAVALGALGAHVAGDAIRELLRGRPDPRRGPTP